MCDDPAGGDQHQPVEGGEHQPAARGRLSDRGAGSSREVAMQLSIASWLVVSCDGGVAGWMCAVRATREKRKKGRRGEEIEQK